MSDVFGDYRLGELLGAGGMGRVFAAEQSSGKSLAIKVLHDTHRNDPMLFDHLADEARMASGIEDRNVVRILGHGTHEGAPYLVMERAYAAPLGALITQNGALPLARVRTIASQILSGLAAIHRAGIVHGDMKSDNVLVDQQDHVTIIDFGLARPQASHPRWLDAAMLSGTPEYMAPELVIGGPITIAAEIYAVGVIVYEMVTGATPFGGGTTTAIFERHLTDEVVPPSLRCPERDIPAALESVIMRALAKEPTSRHFNAEMFATAVERAIKPGHVERASSVAIERAVSSSGPTREWARPTTRQDSSEVNALRTELGDALTSRHADAIIATTLSLVQLLLDEHQLEAAAQQLETVIEELSPQAAPQLWRLEIALGAVHEGLGYHHRAHDAAWRARASAERSGDRAGMRRAGALLQRLPVTLAR